MNIRLVRSPLLIAIVFFTLLPHLFSQEITHATPATNDQLSTWLHSNDPRLVAWAATLARERKQTAFIAQLPGWLKQSPLIQDYGYSPNREDNRAYDAVLDALIRGSSQPAVEPNVLRDLGRTYPIQAFLLLDRLSAAQQLPVLKEWFSLYELDRQRSGLAHLAAMRLAQWPSPVPGFAARIVAATEEQLIIDLRSTSDEDDAGVGTGMCGDSFSRPPAAGWPAVYFPFAEEGPNQSETNSTLIALGDDRVSYRWVKENSPGGSCAGLGGLDQHFHHEVVAYWLKQPQNAMKWQVTKYISVQWKNRASFDSTLGRLLEHEEENFASMANELAQADLLSKDEATWARPRLVVRVVCQIQPCPVQGASTEPLPEGWQQPFF